MSHLYSPDSTLPCIHCGKYKNDPVHAMSKSAPGPTPEQLPENVRRCPLCSRLTCGSWREGQPCDHDIYPELDACEAWTIERLKRQVADLSARLAVAEQVLLGSLPT